MNRPLTFAVVGCGRMGAVHAETLTNDSRSSVTVLVDRDAAAAEALRGRLVPDARVCVSLSEALETQPDAVVIATPPHHHYEQICPCLDAGCHVLAEKPLACTDRQTEDLIDRAEHATCHAMVAWQRRFWPGFRFVRQRIREQHLGTVRSVVCISSENWESTSTGTWRNDPNVIAGGYAEDAGSHKIDAIVYATERKPIDVAAVQSCGSSRVPIVTFLCGHLDGSIPFSMAFTGNAARWHQEMRFHCEQGDWIVRDDRVFLARGETAAVVDLSAEDFDRGAGSDPVTGLLDVLTKGASNPAPFASARPVRRLLSAVDESVRTGRRIVL